MNFATSQYVQRHSYIIIALHQLYHNKSADFMQALTHFEAAEKLNDEGVEFLQNWLLLGKTHLQLKNKPEAKKWLTKVTESGESSPEVTVFSQSQC